MPRSISLYHTNPLKRAFDIVVAGLLLVLVFPFMSIISLAVLISEGFPIIYTQKRLGKNGTTFTMYKFRTMHRGADLEQIKYRYFNEANGPVFKIKDDPRFVGIGKWLSKTGLDELPQFINVLIGNMSLIGPRPLPISEAYEVEKRYPWRTLNKPGIFSLWVINGAHSMSFEQWMKLDQQYLYYASISMDISIMIAIIRQEIVRIFDEIFLAPSYAMAVVIMIILMAMGK